MKMPPSTIHTLTEHPQLMQRICLRIAIRRHLEAETLPAPESWQSTPQAESSWPLIIGAACLHAIAWLVTLWLAHLAAH